MASRESLKVLCKQLNGRQREALCRSLRSLAVGRQGGSHEAKSAGLDSGGKGFRVARLGGARTVSSSSH